MDILALVLIVIGACILFFATRFMGKALKMVTKVLLIVILVLVILTALVFKDMNELRKGFANNSNTFFLYENGNLYTALTLKPLANNTISMDSFEHFTKEELAKTEEELNNKTYAALLANNYRIFIFKPIVLNKPYTLDLGIKLSEGDLLEIIMSNEPFKVLAKKTNVTYNLGIDIVAKGLSDMYGGDEKIKAYLFAALLANYFQHQTPGELTMNIRQKRIMIYPETITFKIIQYVPLS